MTEQTTVEQTTFEQLTDILTECLGCQATDVTLESTFSQLDADSMDVVEVVMAVEEGFDLQIPDSECAHLWQEDGHTIAELVELIDRKLATPRG
jgi:acyl carrier protein